MLGLRPAVDPTVHRRERLMPTWLIVTIIVTGIVTVGCALGQFAWWYGMEPFSHRRDCRCRRCERERRNTARRVARYDRLAGR